MTYRGPFGMIDPAYHERIVAAANAVMEKLEERWHGKHASELEIKQAVYHYRDVVAGKDAK